MCPNNLGNIDEINSFSFYDKYNNNLNMNLNNQNNSNNNYINNNIYDINY